MKLNLILSAQWPLWDSYILRTVPKHPNTKPNFKSIQNLKVHTWYDFTWVYFSRQAFKSMQGYKRFWTEWQKRPCEHLIHYTDSDIFTLPSAIHRCEHQSWNNNRPSASVNSVSSMAYNAIVTSSVAYCLRQGRCRITGKSMHLQNKRPTSKYDVNKC